MSCANCPCTACAEEKSWPCPLYAGREICETCCFWESGAEDFGSRLGLTYEQALAICDQCGKNAEIRNPDNWEVIYERPSGEGQ